MAKRTSKALRDVMTALVLVVLAVVVPWSCKLDTTPIIKPHPPVESDDSDSGETND